VQRQTALVLRIEAKMKAAFCLFVVMLLAVVAPSVAAETAGTLALTHVTVIDASGRPAQADQTVVVSAGRITAMGPSGTLRPPKDARVIDARGKFLIPGLWDMHVHIAGISADPAWSKQVILPELIAYGIVGVRDMGGDLDVLLAWKREIDAGTLVGPHIVAGGPMLVPRGKKNAEQYPVANADEARQAVRELKQRGADFIKIIGMPSREAFFAVADEAKKQGLSFVGHVPAVVTAAEASDAGMHSIEHIVYSGLALDCSSREKELREAVMQARANRDANASAKALVDAADSFSAEKAAELWSRFKKNGTWVVPTLKSISVQTPSKLTPEQQAADPQLDFVPEALRKQWDPRLPDNKASEADQKWWSRQFANDEKLTREMHRAGVATLAGSDSLDRFVFPGSSLHAELQLLQSNGYTSLEALQSATRDAARFLGREKEYGTVTVGAHADLVLLGANPLDDIANISKISAVVREGEFLDRTALDTLLMQAKAAAKAVPAK
jgi:imidazolonepropionase-like amidohydrolase